MQDMWENVGVEICRRMWVESCCARICGKMWVLRYVGGYGFRVVVLGYMGKCVC